MTGVLFFDGRCGMCTRSRNLLLKFDRTGDLRTEPLQADDAARRLGIPESQRLDAARWLDASGAVYTGAEAVNAALSCALGTPCRCGSTVFLAFARFRKRCTGGSPITATVSRAPRRTASRIRCPAERSAQRCSNRTSVHAGLSAR